jgi:hypothetical protein
MILYDRGILDMSDARAAQDRGDVLVIDRAPIGAIQALYHAATGKIENLKKGFTKNFVVRKNDLEQLHYRILQQLDHFE